MLESLSPVTEILAFASYRACVSAVNALEACAFLVPSFVVVRGAYPFTAFTRDMHAVFAAWQGYFHFCSFLIFSMSSMAM